MSGSGPPGSPPANQDRVPVDPNSDLLLPGPILAPIGTLALTGDDSYDELTLRPSLSEERAMIVPGPDSPDSPEIIPGPDSPDIIPLDIVPSFHTIDPLRPPPPSFDEVPPTPPGYQAQAPPPPPPLPVQGGTRSRFTFPTWEEIRASFERFRLRISGEGNAEPGAKKRKRDRAKKTAKACWRKLGMGKKEEEEDRDGEGGSQAPQQASPVVAPTVVFIKK